MYQHRPRPPNFSMDSRSINKENKAGSSPRKPEMMNRGKKFSEEWNAYSNFIKSRESEFDTGGTAQSARTGRVPQPPKNPSGNYKRSSVDMGRKKVGSRPGSSLGGPDFSMIENAKIRQKLEEGFASASAATDMSQRVERRFMYWKSFWENIQTLRHGEEGADVKMPEKAPGKGGVKDISNFAPKFQTKQQKPAAAGVKTPSRKSRSKDVKIKDVNVKTNKPAKQPQTDRTPNRERKPATPQRKDVRTPVKDSAAAKAPVDPTAFRIKTPPEAQRKGNPILERFWAEEIARNGVPRLPEKKKKRPTFVAPERPEDAKAMWADMKKELDKKLSKQEKKSNSSSSHTTSSSSYPQAHVAKENMYERPSRPPPPMPPQTDPLWRLSVKDLKQRLSWAGVSIGGFSEKGELVALLRESEKKAAKRREQEARDRERAAERRAAAVEKKKEEAKQEVIRDRIIKEVNQWAKGKNIKKMLNDVLGLKTPDKNYLKRYDTLTPVSKMYKKAILKIHPDKHMGDFAQYVRATELFKQVNGAFTSYKQKVDRPIHLHRRR